MNIIVGMMMPLMNWARKLAWYSASLRYGELAVGLRLAAEDLDELVTGEGLLDDARSPRRCSSTAGRSASALRLPIIAVTTMVIGIVTRARSASSGEIHTIIATIATTVSSEVSSWLSVCCRLCATLSMSLVTRLSSSPRGCPSKYGQRQAVELVLDVAAQPEDRAVDGDGEQPALEPLQQGGHEVDARARRAGPGPAR